MRIEDIASYADSKPDLVKIEFAVEKIDGSNYFTVVKTKETYNFATEEEQEAMVDSVRQSPFFASVEKKYKAGKVNKAGEQVKPEIWSVIAKFNY